MDKRTVLASVVLIIVGLLALACSMTALLPGMDMWHWGPWRLWPLIVVVAGGTFVLPPLLKRDRPGLGALFIPGVPVLVTGGVLLFTSVFGIWGAWSWLWPQEVLAVALGFLLAAISMRTTWIRQAHHKWLLIPAIIIGANGTLMQFCAITGWWRVWAVLWTIEPLSVGLALLAVYLQRRSPGLLVAGIVLCALACAGGVGSVAITALSTVLPAWWLWRWIGPVTFILAGAALLIWGLARHTSSLNPATG